jgi:hypothetical protein
MCEFVVDNSGVGERVCYDIAEPRQERSNSIASPIDAGLFLNSGLRIDRVVIINKANRQQKDQTVNGGGCWTFATNCHGGEELGEG